MFADSRYAAIEKKCRYADIADADMNIGTPLLWSTQSNIRSFGIKIKYADMQSIDLSVLSLL